MRILQLAFGNWFSRAYLIGVALVAAFVTVTVLTWDQPDANLAGVWLIFVTLPFSLPLLAITPDSVLGPVTFYAACALAAFANAATIGAMVALYRRTRRHPAH
ncbi:SCO4225 family membrane protein [Cryptosporangium sp. NPDC048952]|uniref:SCO4225 family membrane protein n=1 Tax=Cryptosporangium sp. NPDC048952 TaxID=3363961 RepID=UPI0037228DA5